MADFRALIILFVLAFAIPAHLLAEPSPEPSSNFSYEVHVSSANIALTDELKLELSLVFPQSYHVNAAALREHLLQYGAFGIASFRLVAENSGIPKPDSDGKLHQTLTFTLEPQLPGEYQLTFLSIPFEPNSKTSGEPVELLSGLYNVQVAMPNLKNRLEPMAAPLLKLDPQPPVDLSSENRRTLKDNPELIKQEEQRNVRIRQQRSISWIGLIALLAAIALLLSTRKKKEIKAVEKKPDPRQVALSRLKSLQEEKPNADQLYVGLTSAVRKYLESKFHIPAQSRTTEEFLKELTVHPQFDEETRQALLSFLESADLVKFGQYHPSDTEREAAIAAAQKIFNQ